MAILGSVNTVTANEFEERLALLCLRGSGFPKRPRDRHILYRSVIQTLDTTTPYSEQQLNMALQNWLSEIGGVLDTDHVTLRRYLVDEGYLVRDAKGSAYSANPVGRRIVEFEETVAALDPFALVKAAKERAAARKREHTRRT